VLVDEKSIPAGGTGRSTDARIERLESMVWNAIGVDSTRGDRVSIMAVPFETVALDAAASEPAAQKAPTDLIQIAERLSRPLIGLVAIIGLLMLAMGALRSSGSGRAAAGPASGGEPAGLRSEAPDGNGAVAAPSRNRLAGAASEPAETTAQVLRAWLAES
jgi:flagellar biosynthesis/type III secretory pathway M-ring protein FliF/YscJ